LTEISVNPLLTLPGIAVEVFQYKLGNGCTLRARPNKSALERG